MNARLIAFCAAPACTASFVHDVKADPKLLPSPVNAVWAAAEKDVVGGWMDRASKYWEVQFEPNHTLHAYHGDYGALGPYVSTWKLVNNHVIVSDSAALRKQGFFDDWGNDFLVMKVKHHIVLLPMKNLPLAQKYGLASPLCLWRSTKDGVDDLVDKTIDNRKVFEQLEHEQIKQKQDGK